jgi:exodeoxyribonuclease-3
MRIATWNVNSVRARLERVIGWLDTAAPDVACLQETKATDADFPLAAFTARGWRVVTHGQKTYNGVAIVARSEPQAVVRGMGDGDPDAEARFLAATVGGVRLIDVYVPNGQEVSSAKYDYKLRWLKRLRGFLDSNHRPDEPLVVCGDFNIAMDDRDVWDVAKWQGQCLFSEPEKAALRDVQAFGLVDALRLRHADAGLFTWWDYRMGAFHRGWGLRIDHFLVTSSIAARLRDVTIDREARKGEQPSDHAPVVLDLSEES